MKKGRAIKLDSEARPVGPGGKPGRKSMGAISIGELAGSLLRDVIRKRDESR